MSIIIVRQKNTLFDLISQNQQQNNNIKQERSKNGIKNSKY